MDRKCLPHTVVLVHVGFYVGWMMIRPFLCDTARQLLHHGQTSNMSNMSKKQKSKRVEKFENSVRFGERNW
jgi:hypothetical protein